MITTNNGYWNPLSWAVLFFFIMLFVYLIRALGNKRYQKEQGKPFLSGNVEESYENARAGDIYWGFFEAFRPLYRMLINWHNGIISDYVGMFIIALTIMLIALLIS